MINSFVFLDVSQLTIAKMDHVSLLQTNERVPELGFKYMRSDKFPQLTKNSFAIINSVPSND